jgi:dTMP kinase
LALKKELVFQADTLARLFAADRGEHVYANGGIYERCRKGELVVCDRYVLSSLVYQGIECGDELPFSLNSSFPAPQLLVFFDIEPQIAQQRMGSRPSLEIYEHLDFQKKVRDKYLSLLGWYSKNGVRVEMIDASQTVEKVTEDVWSVLAKLPIINKGN